MKGPAPSVSQLWHGNTYKALSVGQQLPQDHRRVRNNARSRLAQRVPSPGTPLFPGCIIDLQNKMWRAYRTKTKPWTRNLKGHPGSSSKLYPHCGQLLTQFGFNPAIISTGIVPHNSVLVPETAKSLFSRQVQPWMRPRSIPVSAFGLLIQAD